MTPDDEAVLTTAEAATLLRVSVKNIQTMVRHNLLPVHRFGSKGRVWRFVRSELLAPPPPTESSVTWDMLQTRPMRSPAPTAPQPGRRLEKVKGGVRYR